MKIPARLGSSAVVALLSVAAICAQDRIITNAIEVRSLPVAEAQRGLEAHLRGTVIFFEPSAVFVQDETSTTFFRPRSLGALQLGDEIEVKGRTQPGFFLPGLGVAEFTILRHTALPPATPANYDDLVSARFHYQRVVVEGIVRSLTPFEKNRSLLRLALGQRILDVRIEAPPDRERGLVDSRVRVHGLAAGFINDRRQLVQPYLRVQHWSEVTMLDAATPAEHVPLISAPELLAFRITGLGERRVRIAGVVTAAFPKGPVYLRQEKTAFAVRINTPVTLEAGDRIEILGFPEMDLFSASVADAALLSREPGPPLAPVAVPSPSRLTGAYDGNLVAVTAMLTNVFKTDSGITLVLQDQNRTVQARVPEPGAVAEPGSRVRVTGICIVESGQVSPGFTTQASVISLRPRSAADIAVLQSPSWWTARRLATMLVALSGCTLLAAIWIAALRRQVTRQTTALRRRIESEAVLEERQRIAREFHDTLEQELAGVSLRLDALATREIDEKGRNLITGSRNLVARIQAETRDLISDLRDSTETAGDLTAALAGVAARHAADSGADVRLEGATDIPSLPATTVHDLRMIVRESVTNALKHGHAKHVSIQLESRDGKLMMRIVDDGCGFDAAGATWEKRGHFGCAGIRERVRKIGAELTWTSALQKGTTVEVVLPIPMNGDAAPPPRDDVLNARGTPRLQ